MFIAKFNINWTDIRYISFDSVSGLPRRHAETGALEYTDQDKAFVRIKKGELISDNCFDRKDRDEFINGGLITEYYGPPVIANWTVKGEGKDRTFLHREDKREELDKRSKVFQAIDSASNKKPPGYEAPVA